MSISQHQYLTKILRSPVYRAAIHTDCARMDILSDALGCDVFLKREDQQPVRSFKLRGAFNRMVELQQQGCEGVICASAGNHAQGVAFSAKVLNIPAVIVMPETTPDIKINAVRRFGGDWVTIVSQGSSFSEAYEHALELEQQQQLTPVPPYDHPDVIAGQGTVAKELLEQMNDIDYLFVAVGGGGLAAGMAVYLKQVLPHIRIIAVESEESACLADAMRAGYPVKLNDVGIFADGVAVKQIGTETFRLCQQLVDDVITVSNDEICSAIKTTFEDTRVIAEPAGALSVAGIKKFAQANDVRGKRVAGVLCGANINFHTLRYVSERCELGEQKEAVIGVELPERKGAFLGFCRCLEGFGITEFNYRRSDATKAQVFVGLKLKRGRVELDSLLQYLEQQNYQCHDLSNDELAKLHVRYMIGGHPVLSAPELVYRFAFPERPGALLSFLEHIGSDFDISLFHYRNHGAAEGLALVGFIENTDSDTSLQQHLDSTGYYYQAAQESKAFQLFLAGMQG